MGNRGRGPAQKPKVLIILSNIHADRVREAVAQFNEKAQTKIQQDKRINGAIVAALQLLWQTPEGMYEDELSVALQLRIRPRLSEEELNEILVAVKTVIPPREEEDRIKLLREQRRKQIAKSR